MAFLSCIPSSSSSSSSSTPQWDVFLSFRGEDTREKFVDHLYAALYRKGISTFKDDEKLETGRPVGPELLKAIEESRYSIVVLSENYASSRWCLDELVHILGSCSRKNNAMGRRHSTIYPVFYHVDPSNVRRQDGIFGEGFTKAASKHGEEKAQEWRKALKEVGNLKGRKYPSNQYRFESKFIEALVGEICSKGDGIYASVGENLVGIHSHVEKVIQLLGLGLDDHARAVGIWGMGGTSKTTITRAVFHRICHQFEAFSYLKDVREVSTTRSGLLSRQQQLISEILGPKDLDIRNTFTRERMIRNRVCNKKVLIDLDEVFRKLKISYDALCWTEQQIFLDIACFLKGENITCVTQIFDSCGYYAEIGIRILVDQSLISFKDNRVWMHDLIQEFGWNIVCQEYRDPGERSKL